MVMVGECSDDRRFGLVDPVSFTEAQFESEVAKALMCFRLGYKCIPFRGTFSFEGRKSRADLALVAPDASHWFVIEVELVSHSLEQHVLPQLQVLRYGRWEDDCISTLASSLDISRGQAVNFLDNVPKRVAVVANKNFRSWELALLGLDVQMLSVSVFRTGNGVVAYGVEGTLDVRKESLGFGKYSATDGAIMFASTIRIPNGEIQIEDSSGVLSNWIVRRDGKMAWISKVIGVPDIDDGASIQIVKTVEGYLSLRRPYAV